MTLEKGDAQNDEKEDTQNKEGYQKKEDTPNNEANPKKEYTQNIENAQRHENHGKENVEDIKMNQRHETSKQDEIKVKETPAEREIQEKEKVSCNVCQLVCEDAKYLRNHRIKEHKQHMNDPLMEPLYSCDQCDFDSEDIDSVKAHKEINIHNIVNHNKTFQEEIIKNSKKNKILSCYLCDFETSEFSQMDEHGNTAHGIINCDKCEFCAIDEAIMKQHMKKHTGRILFTCNVCEFETTKQSMLENHIEEKHKKHEPWWHQDKHENHFCERCEKSFPNIFLRKYHNCTPLSKYACDICTFMAITLDELLDHYEDSHTRQRNRCSSCDFKAKDEEELKDHILTQHEDKRKPCPHCVFIAKDEEVLKVHILSKHEEV